MHSSPDNLIMTGKGRKDKEQQKREAARALIVADEVSVGITKEEIEQNLQ